jgi:hypothetical protein
MANMLRDGFNFLADQLAAYAGDSARLCRGADSTAITVVSQGDGGDREYMTKLGETPEETVYVQHPPEQGYCGFLVKVSEYKIAGQAVLPAVGDIITIDGEPYPLTAPDGTLPWKYHPNPQFKTWFWLHTKLASV